MNNIEATVKFILLYIAIMSFFAAVLTILDKYFAVTHKWRIPESVLLIFGFLGGAAAEYAVMKMIRHKTKHKKFMIGLPVMIAIHLTIIVILELFVHGIL